MIAWTNWSYFLSLLEVIGNIIRWIVRKIPYLWIEGIFSQPYYLWVIIVIIITIALGYILSHMRKEPYLLFGTYLGHILCWFSLIFTYTVLFFWLWQEIVDMTPFWIIFPWAPNTTWSDVPPNDTLLPFLFYIIFCFVAGILITKIIDNKYKIIFSKKKHIIMILLLLYLLLSGIGILGLLYD